MNKMKLFLGVSIFCLSQAAFAVPSITSMHNTALQHEINKVEQINLDSSLLMAQHIWSQKQSTVYHSTLTDAANWQGKRVYDLISLALARENQRLNSTTKQADSSIIVPLTQTLVLLQNTTNPDQDIREARLLLSQALMLEEIRLYRVNS